nr:GRB10-interacting GYF protein 2-like [Procambarus clarkii]
MRRKLASGRVGSKVVWSLVEERQRYSSKDIIPHLNQEDGTVATSNQEKAVLLANHLAAKMQVPDPERQPSHPAPSTVSRITEVVIKQAEVLHLLKMLDTSKAVGPDKKGRNANHFKTHQSQTFIDFYLGKRRSEEEEEEEEEENRRKTEEKKKKEEAYKEEVEVGKEEEAGNEGEEEEEKETEEEEAGKEDEGEKEEGKTEKEEAGRKKKEKKRNKKKKEKKRNKKKKEKKREWQNPNDEVGTLVRATKAEILTLVNEYNLMAPHGATKTDLPNIILDHLLDNDAITPESHEQYLIADKSALAAMKLKLELANGNANEREAALQREQVEFQRERDQEMLEFRERELEIQREL